MHFIITDRQHKDTAITYGGDTPAIALTYAYTSDNRDEGYTITLPNGMLLSRTVIHDPYRRSLVKAITNSASGVPHKPLAYTYDLLNRVTSRNADTFDYNARSEVTSAIIQPAHTNRYAFDNIGSAPSEARRFLRGGSPRRVRTSHPLVPSVGTMEEESNPNEVV
ncbi:MAG: hypothetical protein ACOX5G_02560 [Kiritimatiellia bacterium]